MQNKLRTTTSHNGSFQHYFEANWHYWVIALLSLSAFVLLYGHKIINPGYTDWLLGKGDLSQHYIGWQAFKNGNWLFPIGLTDQLAYPTHTSIIFTDSIPILAVFFKLFRAILPTEFQYFGIWGILCFVLLGIFSARIIERFVPNRLYVIIASMFFVIAPVMLLRMYNHTALAGQWLILVALDIFFGNPTMSDRSAYLGWAILGVLCASIHLYFLLICGIILAGCCLEEIIRTRKLKRAIFIALSFLFAAGATVALLGGFSSSMSATNEGLGIFSFNLNALYNSMNFSKLFPGLPVCDGRQAEGFAYLGAGIFVFLALSVVAVATSKKVRAGLRARSSQIIAILAMLLAALIVSVSPIVTLNDKVLFQVPIPHKLEQLWSIFRATGRIGWIMVYLIMLGTVILSYRFINRRSAVVLAALMLGLQVYDLQDQLAMRHREFSNGIVFQSQLADASFWDSAAKVGSIKHVVMLQRFLQFPINMSWSIANWAMDNNLTLNDFYFARDNADVFVKSRAELIANPDASELFLMNSADVFETAAMDLYYYRVDGLIVGSVDPIPGQTAADPKDFLSDRYTFGDGYFISGEEKDGARYLNAGGISFGPFWALPKGTYQVVVSGDNLAQCLVKSYSLSGSLLHEVSGITMRDDQISLTVTIEEDTFTFEVCILNQSSDEARLDYIDFTRLG